MKGLTKDHLKRRDELTKQLTDAKSEVESAVEEFNERLSGLKAKVESAVSKYNEAVSDANAFREEVRDDIQAVHGQRERTGRGTTTERGEAK